MFSDRLGTAIITLFVLASGGAHLHAQEALGRKEFPPGAVRRAEDLPISRLREQIERLPAQAKDRALAWLGDLHFTEQDLPSLQADAEGGIFYTDNFELAPVPETAPAEPQVAAASVPVSPFPANLVFHSRPGAPNVLYLNFTGETVTGTAWNSSLGRSSIPAVAFSTDSDFSTFSDAEQAAIRRIWQRVAEDYAPFNIDVTTQRPATFTTRTAHALITRNTDANGRDNPASNAGGVAYVGVFANSSYASYRPAWIYYNNLANEESYVAEAASHEVGHNLGLSHDGRTDGSEYYGGHGSGDTSWGPLMGTGYNRNVSQWSKGEYFQANNTQDDLATIAGKLTYRTDDHGNTQASATPLAIVGGMTITSTTPENDPTNTSPQNKGVIERNTDVDYFSFASGTGPVNLTINPWVVPSALTRGGNVDLRIELFNASGQLLLTNNASTRTLGLIQTNLVEGVYYIAVRNTGAGTPMASSPSGYTAYGSIGQYFISGTVVPSGVVIPPGAELQVTDITQPEVAGLQFKVTYSDNAAIDVSTIDSNDLLVTGPNGFSELASLLSIDVNSDGTPRVATYVVHPPLATWTQADNGLYTISIRTEQVADTEGSFVPAKDLGQFTVTVPNSLFFASMDVNPGWTFEGAWEYGAPRYSAGNGPASGFSGTRIVGYNLGGNYENRLAATYATTPPIDCSGAANVTLRFRRWLRLKNNDTASIQVSVNGTTWVDVWTTSKPVSDNSWQEVQYTLPSFTAGSSTVRLRWGLASNPSQNDIGWNLDDVALLGDGVLDTTIPSALLSVANITTGGSPIHSATVTYSDNVAISIATLGAGDLLVLGPNNYSNVVEFAGVDTPADGTPRTASYSIPAPGGVWESADNGIYQVVLQDSEVTDTANNPIGETILGTFTVALSDSRQALVVEPIAFSVEEGAQAGFTLRLAEQPSANVNVNLIALGGDPDLVLISADPIIFTPLNWSNAVPVLVRALVDEDRLNGTANFECRSDGLTSVSVAVNEIDTTPVANQPPVVALTGPLEGAEFLVSQTIVLTATASDDGSIAKVEFFADGELVGSVSAAPYTFSTSLAVGTHVLTARATDNLGASTISAGVTINVSAENQAPAVTVTSPSEGATFLTTDSIAFSASATDDSTVSKVEFFAGETLIGADLSDPFSVTSTLPVGTHSITAKATDDAGLSTTSATVRITVKAPNLAPTISLGSPQSTKTLTAPGTVLLEATAADEDGSVAKVEFFNGNSSLGSVSTPPFQFTLNDLAPGNYTFTATATDDAGTTTASTEIQVTVVTEPKITSITTGEVVTIRANATSGVPHTLQSSSDLESWNDVETITPSGSEVEFTAGTVQLHLFFRITVP